MSRAAALLLGACALAAAAAVAAAGPDCVDAHKECGDWAAKGYQCIANSYYMRQACRKSCNVQNCAGRAPPRPWDGYATPYGTRNYASAHPGAQRASGQHFRWAAVGSPLTLPGACAATLSIRLLCVCSCFCCWVAGHLTSIAVRMRVSACWMRSTH